MIKFLNLQIGVVLMAVLFAMPAPGQTSDQYMQLADSLLKVKDLAGSADALREAYSADEGNFDAMRKLVGISIRLGEFEMARQALELLIEYQEMDANSYLEAGRLAWLAREFDIANQYIDLAELVAVLPNEKIPAYRSIVYRGTGRLAEAESLLVAAQKQFPKSTLILSNLGLAVALLRGPEDGFKYVQRAYEIDSTDVYTLSSLASLYLAEGDVEKARSLFEKALKYDPQNFFTKSSFENLDNTAKEMQIPVLMQKGVTYFDKSLYTRARNAFKDVIALDSTFVEAYMNLGFTLNLLGEPRNAIVAFEKGAAIDSSMAPLYIGWGNALAGIGKLDSAIVMYNRAIALDASLPEAHEALKTVKELKDQMSGDKE